MAIAYDNIAADYATHRTLHPVLLRRLIELCATSFTRSVLEVGCGTGNYIAALAASCSARCFGLDPSPKMLDLARQKASPVSWIQGRAESLPFSDGSVGLIFSVDVIHHVQDRPVFFREAIRVLASGGRFLTVTDNEEIIRQRVPLARYFPETVEAELGRYPKQGEITQLLHGSGFEQNMEEIVEFTYTLSDALAFERKAFSSLHLISAEAFERGLARLRGDLRNGPISCNSKYIIYHGLKPSSQ